MRIGIAMPVCVQMPTLAQLTYDCLASLRSTHDLRLYLTVVRPLHSQGFYERVLTLQPQTVLRQVDCCVAAAWNWGFETAVLEGCERLMLLANDTVLRPDTVDRLAAYEGPAHFWSATDDDKPEFTEARPGCDFSCALTTPEHYRRYGCFDENFKPAYHEDNDYVARIHVAGGTVCQVGAARFTHRGSQTIRLDPEMNHHSSYWWTKHERYFRLKWGHLPIDDAETARRQYYRTPFNDPTKAVSWCPPPHFIDGV